MLLAKLWERLLPHVDGNVITFSFEKYMAPSTKLKKVHTFFDSEILVLEIYSYKLKHQLGNNKCAKIRMLISILIIKISKWNRSKSPSVKNG